MKMRERFWLWGQDAGSHHGAAGNATWKLPGTNRMDPAEGAAYFGIKNMCRVVMCGKPEPPFDNESAKLVSMDQVVWSAIGDSGSTRNNDNESDLDEVLRQAGKFPNITGAVLDDFFVARRTPGASYGRHSVESIAKMRDRLHRFPKRPLDLWVVWYKRQLGFEIDDYLNLFDVITYWNMRACSEYAQIDDDIARVVRRTPGKRRLAGCYMWNYGEGKPLTIKEIQDQCEKYHTWIKKGYIEGIVFVSNCIADLGLEAVEWTRNWIGEIGNEETP
ncbi:MAG: hypothetical protein V2A65_10630 [Candidatus Omnitrophota bacterium]